MFLVSHWKEIKTIKPKKSINIGQPTEDSAKTGAVVAKFEQLVKEVDQCFAELGRQMQRESKSRHDFENKLKDKGLQKWVCTAKYRHKVGLRWTFNGWATIK